jgi:hypothetical protein
MSKGRGTKIVIKFNKEILGDVSGLTPIPLGYKPSETPLTIEDNSASGYYSSYVPDRAFDGSTSTYWRSSSTAAGQWIVADLGEGNETVAVKFRWYVNNHRPRLFILGGSNDGENWDTLVDDESPNASGWHEWEFVNSTAYRYYRWTLNSRWSSYYYIYEIELFGREPVGNEQAFTVTGMERNPLFYGEPAPKEYHVAAVERYPETDDTILLHFDEYNRFNNVAGDLTVAYDQIKGNLTGTRAVESFSESFAPEDLESSPLDEHIITVRGEPVVDFINVTYEPGYEAHTVTVTGTGVFVDLIHVDDIPP